jgi:hypothetical protein
MAEEEVQPQNPEGEHPGRKEDSADPQEAQQPEGGGTLGGDAGSEATGAGPSGGATGDTGGAGGGSEATGAGPSGGADTGGGTAGTGGGAEGAGPSGGA